jgi:hypothetical protein
MAAVSGSLSEARNMWGGYSMKREREKERSVLFCALAWLNYRGYFDIETPNLDIAQNTIKLPNFLLSFGPFQNIKFRFTANRLRAPDRGASVSQPRHIINRSFGAARDNQFISPGKTREF